MRGRRRRGRRGRGRRRRGPCKVRVRGPQEDRAFVLCLEAQTPPPHDPGPQQPAEPLTRPWRAGIGRSHWLPA